MKTNEDFDLKSFLGAMCGYVERIFCPSLQFRVDCLIVLAAKMPSKLKILLCLST
jgi:hypothetical protein